MRRRLLLTYLSLLTGVLLALEVPLAVSFAARDTQEVFIDRLNDTARFASLAEPVLRGGQAVTLDAELAQYDALYGIGAAVVNREGEAVALSHQPLPLDDPVVRRHLADALSGERSRIEGVVWPWRSRPLVVSEPVGRGGEVLGAAVTISPTARLRGVILRRWAVLFLVGMVALAASWLAAVGMTRWILRPVRDLDDAAHEITAGDLQARVAASTGPVELRRLAGSFNTMADTVIGSLQRQRAFVAQASHQLRNPLTALRLRVENLGPAVTPDGHEEHKLALEESDRLAGILDGLLALARAEGGHQPLQVVEAGTILDERIHAWRPLADRRGATLVRSGAARGTVLALPGALDQAVDCLIDNALKFAGKGAVITVSLDPAGPAGGDGGMVEVHVIDDGPGLTEEERHHAAERFWRGPGQQNLDGSGLGLAIATVLATSSGGRLDLLPAGAGGLDARLRLRPAPAATA